MATTVLTQHPIGAPFSGTIHNNNLQILENSFADLGPYVISGLTFSAGTGLSVSVVAGTASIGGRVTVASTFVIAGLVDATTNHIYLLNTGAGTSNTTGTPPANSVKLGTAVTAGGVVTTVAMGRTSGRQQFQQPQNLVLGGPAAGTASAGHPRGANLASWNATQAEGFELFGTLPAGAMTLTAAVILAPTSDTRNRLQATGDFITLATRAVVGQTKDQFVAYASDGTTKLTRVLSDGTISSPGTGAGSEHFGLAAQASAAGCTALGPSAVASFTNATAVGISAVASNDYGVALGCATSAGGDSSISIGRGTQAGGLDSVAIGRSALIDPTHTAAICLGGQATSTAARQFVVGGSGGHYITDTYIGGVTDSSPQSTTIHSTGGSGANIAGASITLAGGQGTGSAVGGDLVLKSSLAGGAGSTLNALHELARVSQLGVLSLTQLTSVQDRTAFDMTPSWATATDASRKARADFNIYDTAARLALRIEASGTAAMIGFLGASAVVRPAATDDLRQALINLGLYTTGGASPLNLNGGIITASGSGNSLGATTFTADVTLSTHNLITDTTTGSQIATGSTQKLGFFGATPVVRPASTTDLRQALINLGLYTTGGATPLDLNAGVFTTTGSGNAMGSTTYTGDVTLSTHNLITDTTTGTKIGTATTQKLGFWNHAPAVQPSAYTVTNPTTNRSLNETTATLAQVAQVLGTLIQDFQAVGLVG